MQHLWRRFGSVAIVTMVLLTGLHSSHADTLPASGTIPGAQTQPVPALHQTPVSIAKGAEELATGVVIIEARFGASDGWVDLTDHVRGQVKQGRVQLPSLKPILENVKDPAFGHHKALVVVYRHRQQVRLAIVPSDGVDGGWGSLMLPEPGLQLLVAGNDSDNIVRFDLSSGESTVVAKLATGSQPWAVAVSPAGQIFVGLRGGKKNIVKLVANTTGNTDQPLLATDVTDSIGRFGPGLMKFDHRGILNVAGDTERAVLRYDVATGTLVESLRLRSANLMGLTVNGDSLYAAEYFQKTILRFNLASDPPQGEKFVDHSSELDRPHGMTIGHNGNLIVSNLRNGLLQEYHRETQRFVRTFLDARTIAVSAVKDLHFEPRINHYLLTSGDTVYELSTDGALLARYHTDALRGAVGMAVLPAAR